MKKTTIKLTLSVQMKQDLGNVAALSGGSVPEVIRGYLRDALYTPSQPTQVPPPRAPRVSNKSNKKRKHYENTPEERAVPDEATPYPADFDPPVRITAKANIFDRAAAIRTFRNWAVEKGMRYADWEDAFAVACNKWMFDARPDVFSSNERFTPRNESAIDDAKD